MEHAEMNDGIATNAAHPVHDKTQSSKQTDLR